MMPGPASTEPLDPAAVAAIAIAWFALCAVCWIVARRIERRDAARRAAMSEAEREHEDLDRLAW